MATKNSKQVISFFVAGTPRSAPRKRGGYRFVKRGEKVPIARDDDRDPSKFEWIELVKETAREAMFVNKWKPYMKREAVKASFVFYFNRPKSNKDKFHVSKPDNTRLVEKIEDALEGICYRNDSQLNPKTEFKDYADKNSSPGLFVRLEEFEGV